MSCRQIQSVGIDIGTTTTQVIFSRLELINRAGVSQVPRYEFSKRDIVYVSPVVFTPIDFEGRLREDELAAFIRGQYLAAGMNQQQVESGAIIITGETSKAKNARAAVLALAEELGNFVVASAGPHLESVIAGHGSGAGELSRRETSRVVNIDIGGGTSNYVVFEAGRVVDSACLNVGGRLVELDDLGRVRQVHAPARLICTELFGEGFDPLQLDRAGMERVVQRMAELLFEVLTGEPSPLARALLMTDCLHPSKAYDTVMFSGGVGECYYHPGADVLAFGDIGPLLALAMHGHLALSGLPIQMPAQTVRATVIGAGAHTLSLSGSTIWLNHQHLPVRNIPVVHPLIAWSEVTPGALATEWAHVAMLMDIDLQHDLFALSLPRDLPVTYLQIEACVDELAAFGRRYPNANHPLLVTARQDLGKVLGMLLQPHLVGRELAVIDEVETRDGDYIDIGEPLFGGDIVPVTIKSLAFPS
ncbi:ethanolamine ammonia-lyase reactivating factor EutA [Iodobacter ciconiae]|uniref:Ethanolamine utilization protein EutA n=1 Tax=Iodobacter ciconiae TaxID=2496266 RepID=A0A3S8ZVQ6_9NEIS|nr:ethanolamine ammonia-lyase reactivating factor EutA [Iodobacter ciconiae]AZN37528.1 ethanolamine utilization protein EutA [Iodobacter ciconiae]